MHRLNHVISTIQRKLGARFWIPIIVTSFGLVSLLTATVSNFREREYAAFTSDISDDPSSYRSSHRIGTNRRWCKFFKSYTSRLRSDALTQLMPAFIVVLSRFYTKREAVFRIAIFACRSTLSLSAMKLRLVSISFCHSGWSVLFLANFTTVLTLFDLRHVWRPARLRSHPNPHRSLR